LIAARLRKTDQAGGSATAKATGSGLGRLKDLAASFCYLASQERKEDQRKAYYEKALSCVNRAVETDSKLVAARINRSLCYLSMSDVALKRGDVREASTLAALARDSAQEALGLDRDNALARNNLACAYRGMEQWEEAFSAARQAVEFDPEFLDGWNTLGGLHHSQAHGSLEYQQAIECYEKAVHIDPFFFDGYMNLAASYCGVENAEKALKCYGRAAEIDPDNTEVAERRDAFRAALRGQSGDSENDR
jgi:tetratricopeptide (TPR) repeat protein